MHSFSHIEKCGGCKMMILQVSVDFERSANSTLTLGKKYS